MRPTRYYSKKQEKAVAKALNGKVTANSGATAFQKGDVLLDNWLLECKTCVKEQRTFTLKKEWFDKNREEAFAMHKDYSAVVFNFGDNENYYVIDQKLFQKLTEYLKGD